MREFHSLAEAQTLALAIVDTLPEPFLVLDDQLHVLAASRCFYQVFMENPGQSHGRSLFDIGDGHWDIPGLRKFFYLLKIICGLLFGGNATDRRVHAL